MKNIKFSHEGGCWYCYQQDEELEFSYEFDAYVHLECLNEAAKDLNDREAQIMLREFK